MNDCCSDQESNDRGSEKHSLPRKFSCPENKQLYIEVGKKTILQHIKYSWKYTLNEDKYYFCDDPACDIVYFGINGTKIDKSELRTTVGKKESDEDALVCYCFGVSKSFAAQHPEIKSYVTEQTKINNCACEIRNPSGRCCLKDFPKRTRHCAHEQSDCGNLMMKTS